MSPPHASVHLGMLTGTSLVCANRTGRRALDRRAEQRIAEVKRMFEEGW